MRDHPAAAKDGIRYLTFALMMTIRLPATDRVRIQAERNLLARLAEEIEFERPIAFAQDVA